jgi:NAD(P)-dependent dehydrogenase (short-subunit alcohol dehydrogenase family)
MGEFSGKSVLITGGARGFGRAVGLLFAQEGANVTIADLGEPARVYDEHFVPTSRSGELDSTAAEIEAAGGHAVAVAADVTSAADCQGMVQTATDAFGGIDILIANAGVWSLARAWEFTEEEWDRTIDVNLKGVWLTTKYAVPQMIERRQGKIIMMSSIAGLKAYEWYAPYVAAKHGVIGYMKALAIELGPHGINVNAICPTQMGKPEVSETPDPVWVRSVGHDNPSPEEFERAASSQNLLSHLGIPGFEVVGEAALWLASDRARLVTGHALPMDAGWIVKRGG